jgi:hypothetical protein
MCCARTPPGDGRCRCVKKGRPWRLWDMARDGLNGESPGRGHGGNLVIFPQAHQVVGPRPHPFARTGRGLENGAASEHTQVLVAQRHGPYVREGRGEHESRVVRRIQSCPAAHGIPASVPVPDRPPANPATAMAATNRRGNNGARKGGKKLTGRVAIGVVFVCMGVRHSVSRNHVFFRARTVPLQ